MYFKILYTFIIRQNIKCVIFYCGIFFEHILCYRTISANMVFTIESLRIYKLDVN